ncbi:MAG: hypothetical protein ACFE95_07440 [Candidatus Hodarchaeota archaeon]
MVDFDDALSRFRQIFDQSKILDSPDLKNILIVLDETKDREEFIFNLIKQFHERWESKITFTFLLAVRGYLNQAKEAKIELETLPALIEKVKQQFQGEDELFDVAFFTDEEKSPFYRIEEILDQREIDLIIIPVPFTLFAREEVQSNTSLGATIDNVVNICLMENSIPIFLVRHTQKIPFDNIKVLVRESMFRKDFLGWLFALVSVKAKVTLYHSELSEKEIERVKTYMEIIEERLKVITEDIIIEFMDGQFALVEFCNLMSKEADALIVFQAIKKIEDDAQRITLSLCNQASNVLIFPPLQ